MTGKVVRLKTKTSPQPRPKPAPKRSRKAKPAPVMRTWEILTDLTEGEMYLRFRVRRAAKPNFDKSIHGLIAHQLFVGGDRWSPYTEGSIHHTSIRGVWEVLDEPNEKQG